MRNNLGILLAVIILIISLAYYQIPLILICFLFILTSGVSRLWNRYCLHRIEYSRRLNPNHAFFGEEVVLEIEIANRKILPLTWLKIEDEVPEEFILHKGKAAYFREDRLTMTNVFPIGMYSKLKRRFPFKCSHRGAFLFGPAHIQSGDLFGFFKSHKQIRKQDYLLVYPRLVPLEKLGIQSQQLFGDIRLKHHLFQDPVLTAGVREYQYGDSLKRLHWKSSARLARLQTKVYEPTTTIDISIFLDVRTVKPPSWGSIYQLRELGIITAASVSQSSLDAGFGIGVYVNQKTSFSQGIIRVPHSRHPDQLLKILEALAQLQKVESISIAEFIHQEVYSLPWGSTLVVISAQPDDNLLATLLDLTRAGRCVVLIIVGGTIPELSNDYFPIYRVTDDIAWDLVKQIELKDVS